MKRGESLKLVNKLREQIGTDTFIDVGPGTEALLGITSEELDEAVDSLIYEGYTRATFVIDKIGLDGKTIIMAVGPKILNINIKVVE